MNDLYVIQKRDVMNLKLDMLMRWHIVNRCEWVIRTNWLWRDWMVVVVIRCIM